MMIFSIDEKSIIDIYKNPALNRKETIDKMKQNIDAVDNKEIKTIMEGLIEKLSTINDEDFKNIDLRNTLHATPADIVDMQL